MIKLTFALVRLPHLTRDAFQAYWFNTHAPLVASVAEPLGILRYVQTHSLAEEVSAPLRISRGAPEAYDGVAELWYESLESLGEKMARPQAQAAGQLLLDDERRFIDHARSPLWWGQEKVVLG
jgi:uncharacterized protein (TIGR02118 family)